MKNQNNELTTAHFRFFGELNDFLPFERRNTTFLYNVKGHPAVKDSLEALRVPHPEIDGIVINGHPVDFSYQIKERDKVFVYPQGIHLSHLKIKHLQPKIPSLPKFVLDSHLGKLSRHLRLLGFDSMYKKIFPDQEIILISIKEKRIVLTRDIGLLKNKVIRYGYWLRSSDPMKQLKEILKRFNLYLKIKSFSLCLECNGKIKRVAKRKIVNELPSLVKEYYKEFYQCQDCQKIYWQGSHYERLNKIVSEVRR